MTSAAKKPWKNIVLYGFSAFVAGGAVVLGLVMVLSSYGVAPEIMPAAPLQATAAFPNSKEALDEMSAELAREGARLSGIAPAAGDKK